MTTDNTATIAPTSVTTASQVSPLAVRRLRKPDRVIVSWLASQLASYLEIPAATIDPTIPLAEMGVDSVHAVGLVGDVEVHFDIDVDPTMIFDYPTLSHIADYIGTAVAEQQAVVA
jgi:acyl carrier protein